MLESSDEPNLTSPAALSKPWTGDRRRAILRETLALKSQTIADINWQAIRVLEDPDNPERYSVCFYLLRELQTLLPIHWPEVPQVVPRMKGGALLEWIAGRLDAFAIPPRVDAATGRWTGPITGEFAKFLRKLREKMLRYVAEHPRWQEVHRTTLLVVDPAMGGLPTEAQDQIVKRWMEMAERFNKGTHHGPVDPVRFEAIVREFEAFLGDRVNRATVTHEDHLLDLIRKAEA